MGLQNTNDLATEQQQQTITNYQRLQHLKVPADERSDSAWSTEALWASEEEDTGPLRPIPPDC